MLKDLQRGDTVMSYENGTTICSKIVASDISISRYPVEMLKIELNNGQAGAPKFYLTLSSLPQLVIIFYRIPVEYLRLCLPLFTSTRKL